MVFKIAEEESIDRREDNPGTGQALLMVMFDGKMRLHGEDAPELEVTIELMDDRVVLGHSTGELGSWERRAVRVVPTGGGWFELLLGEERVTFAPRHPGVFGGAASDLAPVEEPKPRRKRRLRRRESVPQVGPALPAEPVAERDDGRPEVAPVPVEAGQEPAGSQADAAEVTKEQQPAEPSGLPRPAAVEADLPASPWEDVPGPEPAEKRRKRGPVVEPKPAGKRRLRGSVKEPHPGAGTAEPVEEGGERRLRRAGAGLARGARRFGLGVSDRLRQTGIVPFDRLPGKDPQRPQLPGHEHAFKELRLPGGLVRNVCQECGQVSISGTAGEG